MEPIAPPVTCFNAADGASLWTSALEIRKPTWNSTDLPRAQWLDARQVYREISEPTRYRIIQEFAAGTQLTASELSPLVGQDRRQVSKHLRVLRNCGLVYEQPGVDRRFLFNGILPVFLRGLQDGVYVVDFGSGVLRIPAPARN